VREGVKNMSIIAFVVGYIIGLATMAIISANDDDDNY
jgi:hypothetical protein